jgi:hypothetical protein
MFHNMNLTMQLVMVELESCCSQNIWRFAPNYFRFFDSQRDQDLHLSLPICYLQVLPNFYAYAKIQKLIEG